MLIAVVQKSSKFNFINHYITIVVRYGLWVTFLALTVSNNLALTQQVIISIGTCDGAGAGSGSSSGASARTFL